VQISTVSSGTVSGNYGTVIYLVNAKNAYEADYTTTGFLFHPTAGSERALSRTQHFYSSGLNTSYKEFGDLGANGYQYQFDISGSTLSNYVALGATPPAPGSGFMTADNLVVSVIQAQQMLIVRVLLLGYRQLITIPIMQPQNLLLTRRLCNWR
jgi:hypothetical protein